MKTTRHDLLYPSAKQPFWGPAQSFPRPVALEDAGYGVSANPDASEHNYLFQVNSVWNANMDNNTRQLQPDVVVGNLTEARETNNKTDFVAACLAGYNVLFVSSVVFTAARTLANQVLIGMDSPDAEIDIDTFDFTLKEVSGYIGIATNGGKLILDGVTHGLIVRGSVTIEEGPNFSGAYILNGLPKGKDQLLKDNDVDHVIGTTVQVNANPEESTVYYDSASSLFKDRAGGTVTFSEGDRLLWAGIDTLTADIDLSAIDNLVHKMAVGFTLPLVANDMLLGTGQRGELNLLGSGILTIAKSEGLRLEHGAMKLVNNAGDYVAKNTIVAVNTSGKNAIINDFDIWRRGTIFSAVNSGDYTADRWVYEKSGSMVHTITQDTDVPLQAESGFKSNYSLKIDCTTADASIAAGDYSIIGQKIRGFNYSQFEGNKATFQIWLKMPKIGVYCIGFRNSGKDRSYVTEVTINAANTYEKKTVTVDFNYSGGTWDYTDGIGLYVTVCLAAGSTYQTTPDSWQTGDFFATSNQVNACDSDLNNVFLSQAQFEPGSVATNFDHEDIEVTETTCKKYYERQNASASGAFTAFGSGVVDSGAIQVTTYIKYKPKRAAPSFNFNGIRIFDGAATIAVNGVNNFQAGLSSGRVAWGVTGGTLTGGNGAIVEADNNASAYIELIAEL